MFIPKEIAQNRLMGVRWIRHRAQGRHYTGSQQDPSLGSALLDRFAGLVPGGLSDCRVLELGPGKGTSLMEAALPRVGSYAAFDVEPYLTAKDAAPLGVDYRVDSSGELPWDDRTFDVIWSHSVLEHVREPAPVLREASRALKPGGIFIASIDLLDHYGNRQDPESVFGFFRYGERTWRWMTSNRSSYCNRLRASDWRHMFADCGFNLVSDKTQPPSASLEALRALPFLDNISDDDLSVAEITLVAQAQG